MKEPEQELKSLLTEQPFEVLTDRDQLLTVAKTYAYGYVQATGGIAVLSDFNKNICHTYSGNFGLAMFALPEYAMDDSSAFETVVFNGVFKEDLLERHVLELRFFHFLKSIPIRNRTDYQASCLIHFRKADSSKLAVLHSTRYLQYQANGSVWLGLCTYIPFPHIQGKMEGCIINTVTGETVHKEQYVPHDRLMLSKRQTEILSLLAQGVSSKQVADRLNISVYTVNRHRQDILSCLRVANTASAVEIGLRLNLI